MKKNFVTVTNYSSYYYEFVYYSKKKLNEFTIKLVTYVTTKTLVTYSRIFYYATVTKQISQK